MMRSVIFLIIVVSLGLFVVFAVQFLTGAPGPSNASNDSLEHLTDSSEPRVQTNLPHIP